MRALSDSGIGTDRSASAEFPSWLLCMELRFIDRDEDSFGVPQNAGYLAERTHVGETKQAAVGAACSIQSEG